MKTVQKIFLVLGLCANLVLSQITPIPGGGGAPGPAGPPGASGLLSGTLASIPATCTVGASLYQATDQPITTQIYACTSTNTWTRVAYTQGTSLPATCVVGRLFFKTDATAGQNIYACTATNTWTVLAGTVTNTGTLIADQPVVGNGGTDLKVGTKSGNTNQFATTNGTQTSGKCVEIDSNGNHVASTSTCGGGTANLLIAKTSSTILTVGSGGVRVSSVPTSVSSATGTISGSTGTSTAYVYWSSGGLLTLGHNGAATITGSGLTVATGVTDFPEDSCPIGIATYTSNVWDSTIYNFGNIAGCTILAPGTGVTITTNAAGVKTINATGSGLGSVTSVDAAGGVQTASGSAITDTGTIRGAYVANAQTGTSYTFLTGDRGKVVTFSNVSSIAVTLPQAGTGFENGWFVIAKNIGAGVVTITPTTSTISGTTSVSLALGEFTIITSNGTNYEAVTNRVNVGSGLSKTSSRSGGVTLDTDPSVVTLTGTQALTNKDVTVTNLDASGATASKPMKVGTSDPATCAVGSYLFRSDTGATKACTATNTWTAVGGGGSPGGSDTQVQFNNSSAFGGSANLTWDNTNKRLKIGGSTQNAALAVKGAADTQMYLQDDSNSGDSASILIGIYGADGNRIAYLRESGGNFAIVNERAGTTTLQTNGSTAVSLDPVADTILLDGTVSTPSRVESTGSGSAALGSNSPAVTNTAPYKWIKVKLSDGSTAYIPAWK